MVATLHDIPPTMSAEPRRTDDRHASHAAPRVRTRVLMTFADSPELYLREEMA
jgi:hypothetical protein